MELKEELKQYAAAIGADSLGVVSAEAYEKLVPNLQKPSMVCEGMGSLLVFVKHMLTGSFATRDLPLQSMNSHLAIDHIERISFDLVEWLESRGYVGIPIPPESADMELQRSPAGPLDFKWVAEQAGIGTVGLELNFLTPDYGPRVYIGVVMTDLELLPDSPLPPDKHLCPGMSCGRCAVICPTQAIPLEARRGAHITEYRNLNKRNCASGAERIGIKPLYLNIEKLIKADPPVEIEKMMANTYWQDFWQSVNNKEGAFAACFECFYVCPPGAKDFRKIIKIPYRKFDIPPGQIRRKFTEKLVTMIYLGPPAERQSNYERDKDFVDVLEFSATRQKPVPRPGKE